MRRGREDGEEREGVRIVRQQQPSQEQGGRGERGGRLIYILALGSSCPLHFSLWSSFPLRGRGGGGGGELLLFG